jgi:hypothetical protein
MRRLAVVGLWFTGVASAAPGTLVHTGRLLGPDGAPVDGARPVVVSLYDGVGTSLWTEPQTLGFADGYFSATLGQSVAIPPATLQAAATVGVVVDSADLRMPLHAAPTALAVQGAVQLTSAPACGAGATGALRYASGSVEVCDGAQWVRLATGSNLAQQGPTTVASGGTVALTATSVMGVYERSGAYDVDGSTVALFHFDGTGTAFTESAAARPVSVFGNAFLDGSRFKFGNASAYFDGAGDWISVPDDPTLDFGTGDFTVDFWMYCENTGTIDATAVSKYASGGNHDWIFEMTATGQIRFRSYNDAGTVIQAVNSPAVVTGGWHHIAGTRASGTFRLFVDGVMVASMSSTMDFNNAQPLVLGRYTDVSDYSYFKGSIEELRLSKGVARWTSNFTPPALGNYVLLRPGVDYTVERAAATGASTTTVRRLKAGTSDLVIDYAP